MQHLVPQHRLMMWQMGPAWRDQLTQPQWHALLSTESSLFLSPWTFHDLKGADYYRVLDLHGRELFAVWNSPWLGVNSLDQILILQSRHGDMYRLLVHRGGQVESGLIVVNRLTPRIELELRGDIQPRRQSALRLTGVNRVGYFLAAPPMPVPTVQMIRTLGRRFEDFFWPEQSGWFATDVGSFGTPLGEGVDRWLPMGNRAFLVMGNDINADVVHRIFQLRIDLDGFSQAAVVQLEVPIV